MMLKPSLIASNFVNKKQLYSASSGVS